MKVRQLVPWWARITTKIVLARLPFSYTFWKRIGVFEHGDMNKPTRALATYSTLAQIAGYPTSPNVVSKKFSFLELGPGDSVFTAMVAKAHGAESIWLVDAGSFATTNPSDYESMAAYLKSLGYRFLIQSPINQIDDVLKACNCRYMTNGVESLAEIPNRSIDFCMSNAVLEHIPKNDFGRLANELQRIMKPGGICVHRVDLKDHLGGGLNNLRFSEWLWESSLFIRSGFYTNRIRFAEMISIFEGADFDCTIVRKVSWDALPISRDALSKTFRTLPEKDLMVSGFDVVLRLKVNDKCVV